MQLFSAPAQLLTSLQAESILHFVAFLPLFHATLHDLHFSKPSFSSFSSLLLTKTLTAYLSTARIFTSQQCHALLARVGTQQQDHYNVNMCCCRCQHFKPCWAIMADSTFTNCFILVRQQQKPEFVFIHAPECLLQKMQTVMTCEGTQGELARKP